LTHFPSAVHFFFLPRRRTFDPLFSVDADSKAVNLGFLFCFFFSPFFVGQILLQVLRFTDGTPRKVCVPFFGPFFCLLFLFSVRITLSRSAAQTPRRKKHFLFRLLIFFFSPIPRLRAPCPPNEGLQIPHLQLLVEPPAFFGLPLFFFLDS